MCYLISFDICLGLEAAARIPLFEYVGDPGHPWSSGRSAGGGQHAWNERFAAAHKEPY